MTSRARSLAYSLCAIAFVFAVLIAPTALRAQEARGTISGTVMDANKAVVPGATVTITNVAMGTSQHIQTNESGLYTVPYLIPGTYRILVEAPGFKRYIRESIELRVNDRLEIVSFEVACEDRSRECFRDEALKDLPRDDHQDWT